MHHDKPQGKDWNFGEEDHEGEMAVSQLHRLNDISSMLLDMISAGDELPGWVQYKLTRAYTDLNDVFGYLEPMADKVMGAGVQPTGVTEAKKGLWYNVNKRKKQGKAPRKPGEKNYPDEKSWQSAKQK